MLTFNPYIHGQSFRLMAPALWLILNQILEQNNRNAYNMCSHGPPVIVNKNNKINYNYFIQLHFFSREISKPHKLTAPMLTIRSK